MVNLNEFMESDWLGTTRLTVNDSVLSRIGFGQIDHAFAVQIRLIVSGGKGHLLQVQAD